MKYFLVIVISFLISACSSQNTESQTNTHTTSSNKVSASYARGFEILKHETYTQINFLNPWKKGDIYTRYILIKKGIKVPNSLPKNAQIVRTPVVSTVALSASQIGLLDALELSDRLSGIGSLKYLYNPKIRTAVDSAKVALIGYEGGLNLEAVIELAPELLIADGFETIDPHLKRIQDSGIPVLYFLDWMETEPLARLEWIKVIGALYEIEKEANTYFETHANAYIDLKVLAQNQTNKPFVFSGNNFKGTWYMAGGNSFLANMFQDAGAAYKWATDSTKGSIPLSLEKVMENHLDDPIWLNPNARSLAELAQTDQRYPLFKAHRLGNVFSPIKRSLETGGNDYWESGMAQPDLLLKDMISIFHPDLLPEHELMYYQRLN